MLETLKTLAAILRDYKEYAFMAIIMVSSGIAITRLWSENKSKEKQILELAMMSQRSRMKTVEVLRDVKEALMALNRKLPE